MKQQGLLRLLRYRPLMVLAAASAIFVVTWLAFSSRGEPADAVGEGGPPPPGPSIETYALLAPGQLHDAVVRFTTTSLQINPDSPDPEEGVQLFGEHWIRYDSEGQPIEYVAVFRRADGTVAQLQQTSAESNSGRVIAESPRGTGKEEFASQGAIGEVLPRGVRASDLRSSGYADEPSASVPALSQVAPWTTVAAIPRHALRVAASTEFTQTVTHDDGYTEFRLVQDNASGRMIHSLITTFATDGSVLRSVERSLGDIEVFDAGDVPAHVWGS